MSVFLPSLFPFLGKCVRRSDGHVARYPAHYATRKGPFSGQKALYHVWPNTSRKRKERLSVKSLGPGDGFGRTRGGKNSRRTSKIRSCWIGQTNAGLRNGNSGYVTNLRVPHPSRFLRRVGQPQFSTRVRWSPIGAFVAIRGTHASQKTRRPRISCYAALYMSTCACL